MLKEYSVYIFYQLKRLELEGTGPLQVRRKAILATMWKNIGLYFFPCPHPFWKPKLKGDALSYLEEESQGSKKLQAMARYY